MVKIMDYTIITQLISSLGFPIIVCGVMAYYILVKDKQYLELINQYQEDIANRDTRYQEKLDSMTSALNANTKVIAELSATLVAMEKVTNDMDSTGN